MFAQGRGSNHLQGTDVTLTGNQETGVYKMHKQFVRACRNREMLARMKTTGTLGMGLKAKSLSGKVTDYVTEAEQR
jgi:pyruvate-formate lyase-activating enzyme